MCYKQYDLKEIVLRMLPLGALYESTDCLIPMFHGTDRRMLELPGEERRELKEACIVFIDCALPISEDLGAFLDWNFVISMLQLSRTTLELRQSYGYYNS